jgi:hypothetical protein
LEPDCGCENTPCKHLLREGEAGKPPIQISNPRQEGRYEQFAGPVEEEQSAGDLGVRSPG